MKRPMTGKIYNILPPAAIKDNAAFTFKGSNGTDSNYVDTAGFKWARFRLFLGATDIAFAVAPKISEATAIDGTGAADITGAALTAPGASDDNKVYIIDVPLEGRQRFLQMVATAGDGTAGTYAAAHVELFGYENDPQTYAGYGLGAAIAMPT